MKRNSFPANRYRYALSWAATVVDKVVSKYPRATDLVCQMYQITRFDLAKYIAKPDPMWRFLRERIKALADLEERIQRPLEYPTIVKWIEDLHHTKHAHMLEDRLDKRFKSLYTEEAGKEREATLKRSGSGASLSSSSSSDPVWVQQDFDFGGGGVDALG